MGKMHADLMSKFAFYNSQCIVPGKNDVQNMQCVTVCAHCVLHIVPGIGDAVSSVALFSICWHRVIQTITNNV